MSGAPIKIKLGGLVHTLRVEIGLAPKIEDATGLGILTICQQFATMASTTSVLTAVFREAFEANGKIYTPEQVFDMFQYEGLMHAYAQARVILAEFLRKPKVGKPGKNEPAASGQSQPTDFR